MENLKKLYVAITLTIMFAGTALADCPVLVPGEMNTPPCAGSQQIVDDNVGQAITAITTDLEIFVLDTVIGGLENLLTVN
jgi:hypothetical protein